MISWQKMETAPKTGEPILGWIEQIDIDNCSKCSEDGSKLCLYHAHGEGLSYSENGPAVIIWGGGFHDSWEDGGANLPDWWFRYGSDFEEVANPVAWAPITAFKHDV